MAVTISDVINPESVNVRSFDITASADSDTNADIVHGIPGLEDPDKELIVTFEPLGAAASLSAWHIVDRDQGDAQTTVRVAKGTTSSSGSADPQVRVHVQRVHSLIR